MVPTPKQHIVIVAAYRGKRLLRWFWNTVTAHAEARALVSERSADRLVIYRFNRADPARLARPSGPCADCCKLIRKSGVRKVEYLSLLGPVVVKVGDYVPYNQPRS